MKIIFTSPFSPIWSVEVSKIANLLDAKAIALGDLLRAEVTSNSALGIEIRSTLDSAKIMGSSLINRLLSNSFLDDPDHKILINYPINVKQAESLAHWIKRTSFKLDAIVAVDSDKASIETKFSRQFHCMDPRHPKREMSNSNPACTICGETMLRSYDVNNDKVARLIDSYYEESGALSAARELSKSLGIAFMSYTTPIKAVEGLTIE